VLSAVVRMLETYFEDFTFGWLVDEIAPQIFLELDFNNEAMNTRRAKEQLEFEFGGRVCVPDIFAEYSTSRVMSMAFEEGCLATDVQSIEADGLMKEDVSSLISSIFGFQVFSSGFVHCDPHPANVMVRRNPVNGGAQVVLLDHGLYKTLGDGFKRDYGDLWTSIVMADIGLMKRTCEKFGVKDMYPLLAAIVTSRPFDEVRPSEERRTKGSSVATASKARSSWSAASTASPPIKFKKITFSSSQILDRRGGVGKRKRVKKTKSDKGDKAMIRMYAERYMKVRQSEEQSVELATLSLVTCRARTFVQEAHHP